MSPEPKKRPRRVPYTPEEVATIIAAKKRREQERLERFKNTGGYKLQNIFNITCFFIYWELVCCFFGPANYQKHYSYKVDPKYGDRYDAGANPVVLELDFYCLNGKTYKLIVDEFIKVPPRFSTVSIGRDFLLHKNLKGSFNGQGTHRLFSASPLLLLTLLALLATSVGYSYNLNENSYSLMALTVLNALTLLGVVTI